MSAALDYMSYLFYFFEEAYRRTPGHQKYMTFSLHFGAVSEPAVHLVFIHIGHVLDSDYKNIYTHVSGVSYMEKVVGEKCLLHIETHSYKLKVKEQQVYHPNEMSYVQCLSQDLETGCLKLAVVIFLGVQIFKGDHNILIFQP